MNQPLSNSQMRDAEALLHPYANAVALRQTGVQIIERGEGVRVFDQTGRPFIEALSGLWCAGLGFGNAELVEAARVQMEKLPYYHLFTGKSHEPAVELAEKIKALAPGRMARVFYQSSGSEANETQVKMAWYYNNALGRPEKKKIISRVKAYHGVTIVAASMTGLPYNHKDFDLPVDRIKHTATPHFWKNAEAGRDRGGLFRAARRRTRGDDPRRGAGHGRGLHRRADHGRRRRDRAARRAISRRSPRSARRHDVLMISDEVICGFGRTGEWFGAQTFDYPLHLDVDGQAADRRLPAAVGGGDQPGHGRGDRGELRQDRHLRARLHLRRPPGRLRRRRSRRSRSTSGSTRRPGCASLAPRFRAHLDRLAAHPLVGEARGVGLIGALELAPNKSPKGFATPGKVAQKTAAETAGRAASSPARSCDSLAFCPPMIITEAEIDEMFAPVEAALDATLDWARAEGHLG